MTFAVDWALKPIIYISSSFCCSSSPIFYIVLLLILLLLILLVLLSLFVHNGNQQRKCLTDLSYALTRYSSWLITEPVELAPDADDIQPIDGQPIPAMDCLGKNWPSSTGAWAKTGPRRQVLGQNLAIVDRCLGKKLILVDRCLGKNWPSSTGAWAIDRCLGKIWLSSTGAWAKN